MTQPFILIDWSGSMTQPGVSAAIVADIAENEEPGTPFRAVTSMGPDCTPEAVLSGTAADVSQLVTEQPFAAFGSIHRAIAEVVPADATPVIYTDLYPDNRPAGDLVKILAGRPHRIVVVTDGNVSGREKIDHDFAGLTYRIIHAAVPQMAA